MSKQTKTKDDPWTLSVYMKNKMWHTREFVGLETAKAEREVLFDRIASALQRGASVFVLIEFDEDTMINVFEISSITLGKGMKPPKIFNPIEALGGYR